MDESLLPREIPEGGVGTCRCDCSDMGVDGGDCKGCGGRICKMGERWEERKEGSRSLFIYVAVRWKPYARNGGAEGHRSVVRCGLRIFFLPLCCTMIFSAKVRTVSRHA